MTAADLEEKLISFAEALIVKASADGTTIEQSVRIFKEVRELYATLTRDPEKGDKAAGRRPTTMSDMRKRLSLVDGGERDGRAESAVQDDSD